MLFTSYSSYGHIYHGAVIYRAAMWYLRIKRIFFSFRSPLHLLEEIILIDDLSDRDYLKAPLDAYISRFPVSFYFLPYLSLLRAA